MNILHIIGSPGAGGVQAYLLDLCKYDRQYGIKRKLLCLYNAEGEHKHEFIRNGVDCYSCTIMPQDNGLRPYLFWKKIRQVLKNLFAYKLFNAIKILKPDIIICEEPSYFNIQMLVCRLLRKPLVWYLGNENQFKYINRKIFNISFEYFLKNNLIIITDSKKTLNKNLDIYKKKLGSKWDQIPILPQTINIDNLFHSTELIHNRDSSVVHIGSIGRLVGEKDFSLLIRVFKKVRKKFGKDVYLSIAGNGPLYRPLKKLVKELGLDKYVKLMGNIEREKIPQFLFSLDIYIQSSMSEGSPLTIKEAMGAGLPIISTNVGGIPEMINDGETGMLVPYGDEDKFVKAIMKMLLMKKSKRKNIGANAREYARKNLSISILAKKQYDIYKKEINKFSVQ